MHHRQQTAPALSILLLIKMHLAWLITKNNTYPQLIIIDDGLDVNHNCIKWEGGYWLSRREAIKMEVSVCDIGEKDGTFICKLIQTYHKKCFIDINDEAGVRLVIGGWAMVMGEWKAWGEYVRSKNHWKYHENGTFLSKQCILTHASSSRLLSVYEERAGLFWQEE